MADKQNRSCLSRLCSTTANTWKYLSVIELIFSQFLHQFLLLSTNVTDFDEVTFPTDVVCYYQARESRTPWWVQETSRVWFLDSAALCLSGRRKNSGRRRASPLRCPSWRSTTRRSEICWIPKGNAFNWWERWGVSHLKPQIGSALGQSHVLSNFYMKNRLCSSLWWVSWHLKLFSAVLGAWQIHYCGVTGTICIVPVHVQWVGSKSGALVYNCDRDNMTFDPHSLCDPKLKKKLTIWQPYGLCWRREKNEA